MVLIHGLWMTPRSWEGWSGRYERRGHGVLAPAWPGLEGLGSGRPHFPGAPGFEEIADQALDWAVRNAGRREGTGGP